MRTAAGPCIGGRAAARCVYGSGGGAGRFRRGLVVRRASDRRARAARSRWSPTGWTIRGTSSQAPDGTLLVDERGGGLTAVLPDGSVREVRADFGDLFAQGETGLMGLTLDPGFAGNRRFYTCQGVAGGGLDRGHRLDGRAGLDVGHPRRRPARRRHPGEPERSGRHGGCRLRFAPTGRC